MKKDIPIAVVTLVCGALMAFVGVGGVLADAMIYGGPHPPPPEPFTGHVLLWLVCIFMGSVLALTGTVRLIVLLRKRLATRK